MKIKIVRPVLVYGPNVKGNLKTMQKWIYKGWFPPIPETENKRSMIHVDDLVRALILIANCEDASGRILNATDGRAYSTREIFDQLCVASLESIPSWSVPQILLNIAKLISPSMKDKIEKLMCDEWYSSRNLEELGFAPLCSIEDINRHVL